LPNCTKKEKEKKRKRKKEKKKCEKCQNPGSLYFAQSVTPIMNSTEQDIM